jgi:23S rRNA (guanosine2251-2'-O)-methyltransferase
VAGNSQRRGAVRKSKKGAQVGSGGQPKRALRGRGPTPPASERTGHPAARRASASRRDAGGHDASRRDGSRSAPRADLNDLLVGRNPVAEALAAKVPATALYVAIGIEADERVTEAIRLAGNRGISILELSRPELDRKTGGLVHQGLALQVPPFDYADLADLLDGVADASTPPLLVALDGVTDPRNLGAVIRSALAFGADAVIVPSRRSAGITATAWRASAGAAAHLPVAQVTNLSRALTQCKEAGLFVIGLDADADTSLDEFDMAGDPLVVVVGSEGRGLSRLVGATCDVRVSIPMADAAESLNASVAASVVLAEVARVRRAG